MSLRIFVIDSDGNEAELDDLYWFEENGVHSFDDARGLWEEKYKFRFLMEGVSNESS